MRTDFLGHCVRFLELPEAINRAQYLTPRLGPEELRRAILGPARVFGGEVEEPLVESLIAEIRANSDQLPILQHALARMWRVAERKNPDRPRIDAQVAQDKDIGGVREALNRHADEVLAALSSEEQAFAAVLFRALAEWADVPPEALKPVIQAFAAPEVSFLHYGRELTDKSVIDLSHEALIRQWSQLQGWVAEEYRHGQGYRRWSQRALEHRDDSPSLLTGADLARALEWWDPGPLPLPLGEGEGEGNQKQPFWHPTPHWAQRYSDVKPEALGEEFERTRRFLIDSRDAERHQREAEQKRLEAEAETERRRAETERRLAESARAGERRAKRLTRIVLVVALLAVALAGIAFVFRYRAQTAEAQRTADLFESQLTHGSLLARVGDYAEARRVLAESAGLDKDISEARRHARNLLAGYADLMGGQAEQVYTGAGAPLVGGVEVSPDGKLLAAAGEQGILVLFDAESGKLLRRLEGHDPKAGQAGVVYGRVFDPQNRWLFSGGSDGRIIRWSLPAGENVGEWQAPDAIRAIAQPEGKFLRAAARMAGLPFGRWAMGRSYGPWKSTAITSPAPMAWLFPRTAAVWPALPSMTPLGSGTGGRVNRC